MVLLCANVTALKMKFSVKDFFSKCDQIFLTVDLVKFTEKILNRKLHFLCSVSILTHASHKGSLLRGHSNN